MQRRQAYTGTLGYGTNRLFSCFVIRFTFKHFWPSLSFHLQIWTEHNMPIGKSEIVLKVQKCIPSFRQKKNFSALTVQAIS